MASSLGLGLRGYVQLWLSMEGLSASEIPLELPPLTFGPAGIKHCELHFLIFGGQLHHGFSQHGHSAPIWRH
jgi:hypothetical protein